MKELTRFLGISIFMCEDFESMAHIHAVYNQYNGVIDAEKFAIFSGNLPPRVAALAVEWVMKNKDVIKENWEMNKAGDAASMKMIPPLVE